MKHFAGSYREQGDMSGSLNNDCSSNNQCAVSKPSSDKQDVSSDELNGTWNHNNVYRDTSSIEYLLLRAKHLRKPQTYIREDSVHQRTFQNQDQCSLQRLKKNDLPIDVVDNIANGLYKNANHLNFYSDCRLIKRSRTYTRQDNFHRRPKDSSVTLEKSRTQINFLPMLGKAKNIEHDCLYSQVKRSMDNLMKSQVDKFPCLTKKTRTALPSISSSKTMASPEVLMKSLSVVYGAPQEQTPGVRKYPPPPLATKKTDNSATGISSSTNPSIYDRSHSAGRRTHTIVSLSSALKVRKPHTSSSQEPFLVVHALRPSKQLQQDDSDETLAEDIKQCLDISACYNRKTIIVDLPQQESEF